MNEHWSLPPAASDPDGLPKAHLPEPFVFAHGYCPLIMADSADFRESRRYVGDLLLDEPDEDDGDTEQANAAFAERYPNYRTCKQWRQMRVDDRARVVLNADELREELACDAFALSITLENCKRQEIDARRGFE
ncbi:hypothetical protein M0208_03780 [Sphingomonas sp. SUN019]|uniref:hypothetical protein n=1 Tax=Sphingomonas sp. SUN019 TaxID=2937788 RepID=UPI00216456B4|nr:hypothetical protein [Sphingomonas sp. SUN019]UVO49672.1 hypothetical protein M0208_03780 [Sphingomonas sp. SUN019]